MGMRGPQRRPDSERGIAENGGVVCEPIQETIEAPAHLSRAGKKEFARLVEQNRAAGVSIRSIDADQYADLAEAILRRRQTDDHREWMAFGRQIDELRSQLNMGPRNRARAGIRDLKKPSSKSITAKVLELARKQS